MKNIAEHIALYLNGRKDVIYHQISKSMLVREHITQCIEENGMIYVQIQGVNGTIPFTFFTEDAQKLIHHWIETRQTPLYRAMNG